MGEEAPKWNPYYDFYYTMSQLRQESGAISYDIQVFMSKNKFM